MARRTKRKRSRRKVALLAAAGVLGETVAMKLRGYRIGRNVVVRCQAGHTFTTIWIPGASLKSLRLGWKRLQRCPVGVHWSIVTPVNESTLTEQQLRAAHEIRDIRIP